jgi:flagellar hook-associated protein 1 FlgK
MGLTTTLSSSLSGLRATQSGLELVANNVANAQTPGYTRKALGLEVSLSGSNSTGVRVTDVKRELDIYLQRQIRTETSGSGYADAKASMLDRLQRLFGAPGADGSMDSFVNSFGASLDALVTSPESSAARTDVIANAQLMAQSLNQVSNQIQQLRSDANSALSDLTFNANNLLQNLGKIQDKLGNATTSGSANADLLDQRDAVLTQLAEIMDIQVLPREGNQISVYTTTGVSLYEAGRAAELVFDKAVSVSPETLYTNNPDTRSIGTILIRNGAGQEIDLLGRDGVKSGQMRAYAEMRDESLVLAQNQADELAASMAHAFGSRQTSDTDGTDGFNIDLGGLQRGDTAGLTFTQGGRTYNVTLVNTANPTSANITNGLTSNPNDIVIGVNFNPADLAGTAAAINAALATNTELPADTPLITLAGTSANPVLSAANNGTATVNAVSSDITVTALNNDGLAVPLFVDAGRGNQVYTGNVDGVPQRLGFASRIAVNPAVVRDPASLVIYQTTPSTTPYPAEAEGTAPLDYAALTAGDTFTFQLSGGSPITLTAGTDFTDNATFLAALNTALGTDGTAALDGLNNLSIELTSTTRTLTLSGEVAEAVGIDGTQKPWVPTLNSDTARPLFLRDAFENTGRLFNPDTGIGGTTPFSGSIGGFARTIVETQGRESEFAARIAEGQSVVLTSLRDRFAESSGVDIDQEMAKLLQLQTAYAANARVMTAVKELMDQLLAI